MQELRERLVNYFDNRITILIILKQKYQEWFHLDLRKQFV